MPKEIQNPNSKKYDFEERTASFGEKVIEFAKTFNATYKHFLDKPSD